MQHLKTGDGTSDDLEMSYLQSKHFSFVFFLVQIFAKICFLFNGKDLYLLIKWVVEKPM